MDVKDIILAASIAKGTGGSGGGVTKEYVDTQVGAVSERVDDVEDVIPSTATAQNKLATSADVLGNSISSTSTTSPITDSADGIVQGLTIYGRSEVIEGEIKSVGDDGLTVTTCGKNLLDVNNVIYGKYINAQGEIYSAAANSHFITSKIYISNQVTLSVFSKGSYEGSIALCAYTENDTYIDTVLSFQIGSLSPLPYSTTVNTPSNCKYLIIRGYYDQKASTIESVQFQIELGSSATPFEPYTSTSAEFTTALPLRSTLDGTTRDELIIGNGKAEAITRCEVVDDNIVPLATPVTTPLTDAEVSAFRGLRTFGSTTNITITDEPDFELDYLKNTDNGQAVADIQTDLQGEIDGLSSGSTSTIVVVTDEPTLYGRPVTVTAGTKTFTGTFDSTGECTFRNLAIYGAVQAESTNSEGVSAKGSTNITYFGTYVVGISFNVATINLTCSDVSFAGVPVSIYHNGEVVTETSLRLNSHGVLEGIAYVENPGRYTAVAVSAGNTVFTSVAVITLKQTYTGTLMASYLPNSDIEHIICEAYGDNFVENALTWGNGQTPVAFNLNGSSVAPTLQEDNSVYIPVMTNNIFASVDLGAPATPFTAYVVMKLRNPGTDSRMIGAMNSRSGGQGILLYSSTIQISSWANETSTGISSAQYVVCAIQFVGTNLGRGFVRGYGYAEKPSATAGQYVTLARPDINPSTGNASPGDGYFKYVAVVNEAESIQTVQANIEHLNSVFLGE